MTLPKTFTTVTRLSKTIAFILFITFPVMAFLFGVKYQEIVDLSKQQNITINDKPLPLPSVGPLNKVNEKDLCSFTIRLPIGYYLQEPTDSFFGKTKTKANLGQICKIILGPRYKPPYEGYSGEQIQINVYPTAFTDIKELIKQGGETDNYLPIHAYYFSIPSMGGEDKVLVFENNFRIYEIFWRNDPTNLENIIKQIVSQL